MRKWAIIRVCNTYVSSYDTIAQAAERNEVPASRIKRSIRSGGEWRRVRSVYEVIKYDGSEVFCYWDGYDSRWWLSVNGVAIRKSDVSRYRDATDEYYTAQDL